MNQPACQCQSSHATKFRIKTTDTFHGAQQCASGERKTTANVNIRQSSRDKVIRVSKSRGWKREEMITQQVNHPPRPLRNKIALLLVLHSNGLVHTLIETPMITLVCNGLAEMIACVPSRQPNILQIFTNCFFFKRCLFLRTCQMRSE